MSSALLQEKVLPAAPFLPAEPSGLGGPGKSSVFTSANGRQRLSAVLKTLVTLPGWMRVTTGAPQLRAAGRWQSFS